MYKNLSAVSIILMLASCGSSTANSPIKPNNDNRRTEEKINSFVSQPAQVNGSQFTQKLEWNVNGKPTLSIEGEIHIVKGNSYIFKGEVGKIYKATLRCGVSTQTIELGKNVNNNTKKNRKTAQQYVDTLRSGEKISKEGLDTILAGLRSDASQVKNLIDKLESQIDKKIIDKSKKELDVISKRLENFKNVTVDASQTILNEVKGISKNLNTIVDELKEKAEKAKLDIKEVFSLNRKVNVITSNKSLSDTLNVVTTQKHNLNLDQFKKLFKNLSKVDEKKISEAVKAAINSSNVIIKEAEDNKRDLTAAEIRILVGNYNSIIKDMNAHEYYIDKLTFKRSSKKLNRTSSNSTVATADSTNEDQPNEFVLFLKESGIMDFIKSIFGELFDWGLGSLKDAIHNSKSPERFRINFAKRGTDKLENLKSNLVLAQSYIKNYEEVFGKSMQLDELSSKIDSALNDIETILEDTKEKLVKSAKDFGEEIQQAAIKIQNEIIDFLVKHSKIAQQNVNKFFTWLQEKVEAGDKTFEELFDNIIAKLESSKRKDSNLNDEEIIFLVKIQASDLKTILEEHKTQNPDDKSIDNLLKMVNKVIESKAKNSEDMLKKVEQYKAERKNSSKNNSPAVSRKNSSNNLIVSSTNRK